MRRPSATRPRRSEDFRRQYVQPGEILVGVVARLDLGKGVREVVLVGDLLQKWGVPFRIILVGSETAGEGGRLPDVSP